MPARRCPRTRGAPTESASHLRPDAWQRCPTHPEPGGRDCQHRALDGGSKTVLRRVGTTASSWIGPIQRTTVASTSVRSTTSSNVIRNSNVRSYLKRLLKECWLEIAFPQSTTNWCTKPVQLDGVSCGVVAVNFVYPSVADINGCQTSACKCNPDLERSARPPWKTAGRPASRLDVGHHRVHGHLHL
ncbi:hypothetical protein PybrP1_006936 [[Pythium] brassicae (nom. inval.)]|nr:hypothetical protein PybrP1_006936 [[Pythium] brassicae (nom. inval.)]